MVDHVYGGDMGVALADRIVTNHYDELCWPVFWLALEDFAVDLIPQLAWEGEKSNRLLLLFVVAFHHEEGLYVLYEKSMILKWKERMQDSIEKC